MLWSARRLGAIVVVAVACAAVSVTAAAAASGPVPERMALAPSTRADDQQIADESALTLADVPTGFQETPTSDARDLQPGGICKPIRAAAKAADAAPHKETEFRTPGSTTGRALVNNQVTVVGTVKRAKAIYAPYAATQAKRCLTTAYQGGLLAQLNSSADVKVTAQRYTPDLGDVAVGYRLEIVASVGSDSQKFYVDVEVVRTGRGIDAFGFFNTGSAPPRDDVNSMTSTGVARLEAAL